MQNFQALDNIEGIYCDAIISHHQQCVFASLWGRAMDVLALYGGITTGSIDCLSLGGQRSWVSKGLQKVQTRMPKHSLYGNDLVHIMLFTDTVQQDSNNKRILIGQEPISPESVWSAVMSLSDLGLLQHWRIPVLQMLQATDMLTELEGYGGLYAMAIQLDQGIFAERISAMLIDGILTV